MALKFKPFLLRTVSNALIISAVLLVVIAFGPTVWGETSYQWRKLLGQNYCLRQVSVTGNNCQETEPSSAFGRLLGKIVQPQNLLLEPPNRDFSVVIEKIGVAAPVVTGVTVDDPEAYREALKGGVAQAAGTALPSDPRGNVYLFAHSSLSFWQLGEYATVFNLLRELAAGDVIYIFYQGRQYRYQTISREIVPGFNTYPLDRRTIEPILTLQTCDPPGTTLNRLVVTAKLVEVV